jgi:hypothetical protein
LKSSSATKKIKERVALSSDAAQNRFSVKATHSHAYKLSHLGLSRLLFVKIIVIDCVTKQVFKTKTAQSEKQVMVPDRTQSFSTKQT